VQRLTMLIARNSHEIGPWAAQPGAHPRRCFAQIAAVALHRHHTLPLIQTRGQFGQSTVDPPRRREMMSSASTCKGELCQ
jgi:hypothetical protein